jgi:recombination protein RecT
MSVGTQPNGQAPAKSSPQRDFLAKLDASREGIQSMIPDPKRVDRIIRLARTAWNTDANLQKCSHQSIMAAVMRACELGLDPCGARKHCYLIPYKAECTLQISYIGMLELAHRSGAFVSIEARTVHEGDEFSLEYVPDPVFRHVPKGRTGDMSLTHAYAYARLKTGGLVIEVLTREQIEDVRVKAQSQKVWGPYYAEMAKKTAIKKLLKRQPSSVEMAEAIEHDNRDYDLAGGGVSIVPTGSRSSQVLSRVRQSLAAPVEPDDDEQNALPPPSPGRVTHESDDDDTPWEPGAEG